MRPLHRLVVLLAGALVATGCSASDTPDPEPGATSGSTSGSAAVDPTESAEPESAELGVCDLLGPADYKRFIRPDLRGATYEKAALDSNLGSMNTCQVWSANFPLLTFGYSTDAGAWSTIVRRTRPDEKLPRGGDPVLRKMAQQMAQKRQEVPNVGQEGYFSSGFGFGDLYALNDDVSYVLSPSALISAGELSVADYIAVMILMTSEASGGIDRDPVQLPAGCPAADSDVVVAAIGEVTHALGSQHDGIAPTCDYLAADGRSLTAGSTFFGSRSNFAREAVEPGGIEGMEVLDPPPGPSSGLRGTRGEWTYHSALPARLETVSIYTGRPHWGPRPSDPVDRKAFMAFVDAYRDLVSDRLGARY